MTAIEDAPAAPETSPSWHRSLIGVMVIIEVVGLVLVVFPGQIASVVRAVMPERGEVTSAGTRFGPLIEVGPGIARRTGLALVATPMLAMLGVVGRRWVRRIDGRVALGVVAVATALWYGWLGRPHNAFPSNARIHWVDYLTWKSDNYFYAAGRLPHLVFYDVPFVWQGINAGVAVVGFFLVARELGLSSSLAAALSSFVALSGNLLNFANTAEDVLLNVTLVTFCLVAVLRRQPVVTGAAFALLLLGRPQFAVVFPAYALAEILPFLLRGRRPARERWVHVAIVGAVTAAGVAVSQLAFTLLGRRYFLSRGRWVDIEELSNLQPREIDDFLIFPFSGTYVLHAMWVLPVLLLVAAAWGLVSSGRRDEHVRVTVMFAGLSIVALVLLQEARPLLYFNVRYLTYLMPFVAVMAWSVLSPVRDVTVRPGNDRWRALTISALLLAPLTIPASPIAFKRFLEDRPEVELLDERDELRDLTRDRIVYVAFGGPGSRNYVSYVLRRPIGDVRSPDDESPARGSVVISPTSDPWASGDPMLATERLVVHVVD